MITKLSYMLAAFFTNQHTIEKSDIDSYAYGFEILLISIINWGSILIIMLITKTIPQTLIYMITVLSLRHHSGGYHAKTHYLCSIITIGTYILFLIVISFVPENILVFLSAASFAVSIVPLMVIAPIEHENNPVSAKDLNRHRVKIRAVSAACYILSIVLFLTKHILLCASFALAMLYVSILLIIEFNKKKTQKKEVIL